MTNCPVALTRARIRHGRAVADEPASTGGVTPVATEAPTAATVNPRTARAIFVP